MPQGTPPDDTTGGYGGYERGGGYRQPSGGPTGQGGQPTGQGGQPTGQQAAGGGYEAASAARPVPEMEVDRPVLRWVTVPHPDQPAAIGPDDYVLDSFFDARYDTWEVLVLVQPTEDEEEEETDEPDEE